jgi:Tfp pilus assembly protein PilN
MMYLKKAIGVFCHDDDLDIEVVARSFAETHFLGSLTLSGVSQKDPLVLRSEVEDFFAGLKIKPENVVVGIAPDQLAFRRLVLPPEAEENLEQAIRLQVMNVVPSETEDFCAEKIVRRGADGKSFEVDLYIIPRERVRKLLDLLRPLGLAPQALTLTAFGFEQLLKKSALAAQPAVFVADLDLNNFAVHVFQEGRFTYFKLAWINPANKNLQNVLKEVERCASLIQLSDDQDIDVLVNVADPNWQEKLVEGEYPFLRYFKECSPFPERTTLNLKPLSVALQALHHTRRSFNLIPEEWREKSSSITLVPTLVLAAALVILLGLSFTRVFFQEASYNELLERNIAKIDREYGDIMKMRRNIVKARNELDTYQQVVKKPLSDLEILRELTEKAGDKTYLSEYVRANNLVISGYTDSVLDLQTRLTAIRFFKGINLQGSITKTKEGLEHYRFEIQLEE